MMRWRPNIGITPGIIFAIALVLSKSALGQNFGRIQSLHTLLRCATPSIFTKAPDTIWMLNFNYRTGCEQQAGISDDPSIVTIWAWLSGKQADPKEISKIQPFARQEIFVWRNRSQSYLPDSYAEPDSPTATQFVARLAVSAWREHQQTQVIPLVKAVITKKSVQEIVDILLYGIMPQQADEYPAFEEVRKVIAQAMPTYVHNYATWFEIALNYQQWESAENACENFRKYAIITMSSLAAICLPRLAFYQGNYALAYRESMQNLKALPTDPLVWTWFGVSAKQLERYQEAADAFQHALQYEKEPDALLNLYWQLGNCQQALGQQSEAQNSYQSALQYDRTGRYQGDLLQLLEQIQ